MTCRFAAGLRCACCVASAAALVAGCSGGARAQREARPSAPGAASSIPAVSASPPSLPPSPRPPVELPDSRRVDQQDATALSRAALSVMYTVDSTVDAGLRDARLRAARYLTPDYTERIKAEPVQYAAGVWRLHRAYLTVQLRPLQREAGAPKDNPTAAYRQWEVTTTPTGRDDWRGVARKFMAYVALIRSSEDEPWRISGVQTRS